MERNLLELSRTFPRILMERDIAFSAKSLYLRTWLARIVINIAGGRGGGKKGSQRLSGVLANPRMLIHVVEICPRKMAVGASQVFSRGSH